MRFRRLAKDFFTLEVRDRKHQDASPFPSYARGEWRGHNNLSWASAIHYEGNMIEPAKGQIVRRYLGSNIRMEPEEADELCVQPGPIDPSRVDLKRQLYWDNPLFCQELQFL